MMTMVDDLLLLCDSRDGPSGGKVGQVGRYKRMKKGEEIISRL